MVDSIDKGAAIPQIKIDNPKNKDGLDLSDHYPIVIEGADFKVVSYNVQFMPMLISNVEHKKNSVDIKKSVDDIVKYFVAEKADVCCVQELFDNTANNLMQEAMRKQGYVATQRAGGGALISFLNGGARTFVKKESIQNLNVYEHLYKNTIDYFIGGDAVVNKGATHTCFTKDGIKHHIFNTHLQAYYPDRDHYAEVTLAQCVELKKFIEVQKSKGIIGSNDKIMMCGDFNIPKPHIGEKASPLYEKLSRLMGPQCTFLDYALTPSSPPYTLSLENTYNKHLKKSSDNDVNVDLAILYEPRNVTSFSCDSQLSDIYCDIQLAISHYVRNNATIFSKWLLSADKIAQLNEFNQQFTDLIEKADEIKLQNTHPMDDQAWFLQAVKLLRGPGKLNTTIEIPVAAVVEPPSINNQDDSELDDMPMTDLSECGEKFDKLLLNLKQLHNEIHATYIASPIKYEKVFETSLKLNHVLRNAGDEFFNNATLKNFKIFQSKCNEQLSTAKNAFENYAGIWSRIHPIFKSILGLIAAITVIPAVLVATNSPNGFVKTFFNAPVSKKLTGIKDEYDIASGQVSPVIKKP